jgi:PPP family 3-phenylpropionic acid transporter
MAAIQPLHGLLFALLHLANMRVLAETALTFYGTVGVGAAVALLRLISGPVPHAHS